MLSRPIHHTFGPHVTLSYLLRSIVLLFTPWTWRSGSARNALRNMLAESSGGDVSLFSSGREALLALLRSIGLRSGEEVIVPTYTCVVLPNAIHAAGGVPVYADVDGDTLNLSVENVRNRMTGRTRAVIVQHTFGIPGPLRALKELCAKNNIVLIEDCAHTLPDEASSPIGRTGDYALLSFGRDKAISGVTGGAIVSRNPDVSELLRHAEEHADELPLITVLRLLSYPLVYASARLLFPIGLGKPFLAICRMLGLLLPIVTKEEKRGLMSPLLHTLPNACAALALHSFRRLGASNAHRRLLTTFYRESTEECGWNVLPSITDNCVLQKFPLFFPEADAIRENLKRKNIHLDDGWTGCTICPRDVDPRGANYTPGSDPKAEEIGERILSLPTHPTTSLKDAQRLIRELARLRAP